MPNLMGERHPPLPECPVLEKGDIAGEGGGPQTNVGDRKRLSTKQHPDKQIFIELGPGESRPSMVFLPFVEASS